jgi:cold shock CspA family protein
MQGTVITSGRGSWGFIQPTDPTLDNVFYHKSQLIGRKRLLTNEVVEFEIGEYNGRQQAINVRVIVPVVPLTSKSAPSADNFEVRP